jgi:hypothetical protein
MIRGSLRVRLGQFFAGLAVILWVTLASAHAARQSLVALDLREAGVMAELRLPLSELGIALKHPLKNDADHVVALYGGEIAKHITDNVSARAMDGRGWTVEVRDLVALSDDTGGDLLAHVWLEPPSGASARAFTLGYDVISREVVNHVAFVSIRSDWQNGVFASKPELVGTIRYLRKSLVIDRKQGSTWTGFRGVVQLGRQHIEEGTDHLLFLLVLFLPAPLLVSGARRWGASGGARYGVKRILLTVSAFTLGHSLTLGAGALGWLRLPSGPVEVLIAVSIFVSAIHALRPLFPGHEPVVAATFGLVHGLAFAGAITELGLDPWRLALAILGFNIGVELMQLFVIAVTVPWLLLLARTPAYVSLRVGGALFGGAAALGWISERALKWSNPFEPLVSSLAHRGVFVVTALALASLVATIVGWLRAPRTAEACS